MIQVNDDSNCKEREVVFNDKDEFMLVRVSDGSVKTVHPDGNSFGMMQGLIVPKAKR